MFALVFLLLVTPALLAQAPTGTIVGVVRYTGVVPPSKKVTLTDGQILLHNDIVVHAKSKGLRDVAVVLSWKEKLPADAKAKPVLIDQRDMIFIPRVVTVQEGQKVRFENNDLYNHAVNALSIHPENVFNVTTPSGQPFEHKFKWQKNPIQIGCVLHNWMRAWVILAQHPYHAVTDSNGKFQIANVPAGKQALTFVHPDTNHRETLAVDVPAGKTIEVTLDWKKLGK